MARQRFHEDSDRDRGGRRRPEADVPDGPRVGGIVRDLIGDKGFGFITGDDGGDRFFHKSEMAPESKPFHELTRGDRCTFVASNGAKGPRAVRVEVSND